jgi:predicted DsbA family dithiol-disulfide isomerase
MGADQRVVRVRVHYDFASSLCYVAHRVMQRMAGALDELGLALDWSPLELARLMGPYRAGAKLSDSRRENAQRVASELGVALAVPHAWPDARAANAAAFSAERMGRGGSWRERIFSAVFEEGRYALEDGDVLALARELELDLGARDLERGRGELELHTELAREAQVSGVPTFMLGDWPFGGIQTEDTMMRVLERFAQRTRAGELVQ